MTSKSTVKVQTIIESQIPDFLRSDSPLFTEFLRQYYISQEFPTGNNDISVNIQNYKNIDTYSRQNFYTKNSTCILTEDLLSFSDEILVSSTIGFPQRYGLLKIGDEIITYTNKTETKFLGCIRGFSGITNIGEEQLNFEFTLAKNHLKPSEVVNLNLVFYEKLFEKFKFQYIPDLYNREIKIDYDLLLSNARSFYLSKGTDISYKLLFSILYNEEVDIIKPKEYLISASDDRQLITQNVLVEFIDEFDISKQNLIGQSIYQDLGQGRTASASIYNIEYRPLNNSNIYEISLDSETFIYDFEITKKAQVFSIDESSEVITVDSTFEFPKSGECIVIPKDNTKDNFKFQYKSKSINQFYEVTSESVISQDDIIFRDNFGYVFDDNSNKILFRFISVIGELDLSSTKLLEVDDVIRLDTFGNQTSNYFTKSLLTNYETIYSVKSINIIQNSGTIQATVELYEFPKVYIGKPIVIIGQSGISTTTTITNINSQNKTLTFSLSGQDILILDENSKIRLNVTTNSSSISNFIQDSYIHPSDESYFIASNGVSSDNISSNNFRFKLEASTTTVLNTLNFNTFAQTGSRVRINHNLLTGNKIVVYSENGETGISTEYFVRVITFNQISLYDSQESILSNRPPISFEASNIVGDAYILGYTPQNVNNFKSQKLFKEIKFPVGIATIANIGVEKSENKPIGMLVNGVELASPDILNEYVYYGEIENISIPDKGQNYDIITPPTLTILDSNGVDCKIHPHMRGHLSDIFIKTPGINYDFPPDIYVTGGNLQEEINIESVVTKRQVNSEFSPNLIVDNVITTVGNHLFENGEEVIYSNNGNLNIGNTTIFNGNSYFVGLVKNPLTDEIDFTKLRLYQSRNGALASNSSELITYVVNSTLFYGLQSLQSVRIKNVIDKVIINSRNQAVLENKVICIPALNVTNISETNGILPNLDQIYAKNHNLQDKDCLIYSPTTGSTPMAGVNTTSKYLVTVIDSNRFKLSSAGTGDFPDYFNFNNNIYVNFTANVGVGTHKFYTPPIQIKVKSRTNENIPIIPLELAPIVLGEFDYIFIENSGSQYGNDEIINYHKRPRIGITQRTDQDLTIDENAVLYPIIQNGKIISVRVFNSGDNYDNNVEIIVRGDGKYAKLYPIIQNRKIVDVRVINSGIGYSPNNTNIEVKSRGNGALFIANVKKWTINSYEKYITVIANNFNSTGTSGGGLAIPSKYENNTSQFINLVPPNNLKSIIENLETSQNSNYLILGWAYDGCPIVFPKQNSTSPYSLTSGYTISNSRISNLNNTRKRPFAWRSGIFLEDYTFSGGTQLDVHNGLYITNDPIIPDGTYAYVITYSSTGGRPTYPYVVGPNFKFKPIDYNFNYGIDQNDELERLEIIKNTEDLFLSSDSVEYLPLSNLSEKYLQEFRVLSTLGSGVNGYNILNAGTDYKIEDRLIFESIEPNVKLPSGKVSQIQGNSINQISITTITNSIEFQPQGRNIVAITSTPHNLKNDYFVKIQLNDVGISTFYSKFDGIRQITVPRQETSVLLEIINDSDDYASFEVLDITKFKVNSFIKIDDEIFKITQIRTKTSKIKANRISTKESHSIGAQITQIPNTFSFIFNDNTEYTVDANIKYFNPSEAIGIETTGRYYSEVGISSVFIPPNTIYLPNHGFNSNERITYSLDIISPLNTTISVSNTATSTPYQIDSSTILYAVNFGPNFVGIKTDINSSPLFFRENSINLGESHYITRYMDEIVGIATNQRINVSTITPHRLETLDKIGFIYQNSQKSNELYQIEKDSSTSFSVNISNYDEILELSTILPSDLNYYTTSKNAQGPIEKIQIESGGNFHKKLPIVNEILSNEGKSAEIILVSNKIGRVDRIERTKDGYDYPSDSTLAPKLSSISIAYLENSYNVINVKVENGGFGYVSPPRIVAVGIEADTYEFSPIMDGGTIDSIQITKSPINLKSKNLELFALNNSNGYEIRSIDKLLSHVTKLEIFLNISEESEFPIINEGDQIFIENCSVENSNENNYNSIDYGYYFYEITSVDTLNRSITVKIPIENVSTNQEFGDYTIINGFGSFTLKSNLPEFSVEYALDDYFINEEIISLSPQDSSQILYKGKVIGWNPELKQLRLSNISGELKSLYSIKSEKSLLTNDCRYVEAFTIPCNLTNHRAKIIYLNSNIEDTNNQYKKLQDSNYYQIFSYSILSKVQYNTWNEPVRSIIHPSGYKEFSDLNIISLPGQNTSMRPSLGESTTDVVVNIDNISKFNTISNYTIGYDEPRLEISTPLAAERIILGTGEDTWPVAYIGNIQVNNITVSSYFENLTNEVIILKDISNQFDGTNEYIKLDDRDVTFDSTEPYIIGISTSDLIIGDLIGISTYLSSTLYTRILNILDGNKIEILYPHKNYTGITTESIEILRPLDKNNLVGISSFKLEGETKGDILKITVPSEINRIDLNSSSINSSNIFKKGQKIYYYNVNGSPIEIQSTDEVIGGIVTDKLPSELYVYESTGDDFKLSGLMDSSPLIFTGIGSGNHIFGFSEPNKYVNITIDNLPQVPLTYRGLDLELAEAIDDEIELIEITSGISSITFRDTLQIGNEYLQVVSIADENNNQIEVRRGSFGSSTENHSQNATIRVYRGNYWINEDILHFSSPPLISAKTEKEIAKFNFSGRVFTRKFDNNTQNIILDNISSQFDGETTFNLLENGNTITGIFTSTNNTESSANISNNPLILINNIIQSPEESFTIEDPNENKINFIEESPRLGKIYRYEYTQGSGYAPLVGASATAILSPSGGVLSLTLNGKGSGYRESPNIEIRSLSGSGASITANIGAGGTITGFNIISPGVGYNTEGFTFVDIDDPLPYRDLILEYSSPGSGIGSFSKVSLEINNDGEIDLLTLVNSGINYKKGDELKIVGIVTTGTGGYVDSIIKIIETADDDFNGLYYGQFIKCNNISSKFNSQRKLFDLFLTSGGIERKITFKGKPGEVIENNLLVLINDIIQEPGVGYRYFSGKLLFSEPPKEGSSSLILYYTGSSTDVIFQEVSQTIKVGDGIKLKDSPFVSFDSSQKERIVKGINGIDSVDTFVYQDYGINYLEPKPIDLIRQENDLIINGEITSRNRISQDCNLIPAAKLIRSVSIGDTAIYLDSAYPLFTKLDENELIKPNRSIRIIENLDYLSVAATTIVSIGKTISSIIFDNSLDYTYSTPPNISISIPTQEYVDPLTNDSTLLNASAEAVLSLSGKLESITIVDGGFGYSQNTTKVLISSPETKYEDIISYDVVGDYGKIVGIITYPQGTSGIGTTTPKLSFELESNIDELEFYGILSSQLEIGDYFIINNSNVVCGHALTGITTEFGGMANYPQSKVGTAVSFLDGVYRVEDIQRPVENVGIVTVSCNFAPNENGGISINMSSLNSNYYGDYSWAKVINFDPRSIDNSYDFSINVDNGIYGINESSNVYRNQPLITLSNRKEIID